MGIITLTTDFGHSMYVAQMKGVILGINPNARIVDIAHDITPQNIFEGAFSLVCTVPHFKNAIHVAVVDPGVGGSRAPIAIECENGTLIGPDNGLLFPAAHKLGFIACYEITNKEFMLPEISNTFHGRDIFAPVAAHMSKGVKVYKVGTRRTGLEKFMIETAYVSKEKAHGRIGRVDGFGNIITNIPRPSIESFLKKDKVIKVYIGKKTSEARVVQTYTSGKDDELLALFSSSGHLELSLKNGSAKDLLRPRPGDEINIFF